MTVVVGFVGPDGAVIASDSEATEGGGHTRYDVEKIWACGGLIMGYTGTTSVKQPLAQALDQMVPQAFSSSNEIDRVQAREVLRQTAAQVLQSCYRFHVGNCDQFGIPIALNGVLLVLGRDSEGYWMLEIDGMAQATFYTEAGFHTVGSGAAAAYVSHSLMRAYDSVGRSVVDLRLIAHRTVQTCIDSIGGSLGVGGYVQLWASEKDGPFQKASRQDLEVIEHGVEQWRKIERESLDQMRLGGAPEPTDVPFPDPPSHQMPDGDPDTAGSDAAQ